MSKPFSQVLLVKILNLGRMKILNSGRMKTEKSLPRLHGDSGVPRREEGTASAWGGSRKKGGDVGRMCVSVCGGEGCRYSHIKEIPYLKILSGSLAGQSLMTVRVGM